METRREKEKAVAEEAKDKEEGSRGIVTTTGPDTPKSIETTETAVTAMIAEMASHTMKATDVAEMNTGIGKSPKRKGGRSEGSPEMIAGREEMMTASETEVATATEETGQIGAKAGLGRTAVPGKMPIVRIADPIVEMMNPSAPTEAGVGAPNAGMRLARTARRGTSGPRRQRMGRPKPAPDPARRGQTGAQAEDHPADREDGRMPAQPPPTPPDSPRKRRQPARVPMKMKTAPHLCPEDPRSRASSARLNGSDGAKSADCCGTYKVQGSGGASRKLCQQRTHEDSTRSLSRGGFEDPALPAYGNWNLSFFAFLLVGETVGAQETSKEATNGASIEGWIAMLHSEEEDGLIREILDSVLQGLDLVMALFEETPSQLHDSVHWKTNEPDFDRCMRHFYPREIPEDMQPKSAPHGERSRGRPRKG